MYLVKTLVALNLFTVVLVLLVLYYSFSTRNFNDDSKSNQVITETHSKSLEYHVWLIFTKIGIDSPLKIKFHNLITNLLNVTSVPLNFHVIIDSASRKIAKEEFESFSTNVKIKFGYFFYDVKEVSQSIQDIVSILTPFFSSRPGTYYSDALFYISLGLYRIAPVQQDLAVMLDCDLYFKDDILLLINEFDRFKSSALFGLAPELTPVYRHVLHKYRLKHTTTFGDFYNFNNLSNYAHPKGYQGYNSGVILFNLKKIRESDIYPTVLTKSFVETAVQKYMFKGHLGDQDFYTLLGYEHPELIQTINCGFNRQLCTWWKYHGYNDVFDDYFKCKHKIVVIHGNCNTRIP